ncbi:MAG: DUF5655 domain-containing protein [Hyphomicrobiaceae bacterium]
MSTDWRQKERDFLDSLLPDTGRDLGQWMALISSQNLPHRNDTIDWLRRQGFTFSRASWLERIHHNGGRPVYLDAADIAASEPKADSAAMVQGAPEAAPEPTSASAPPPQTDAEVAAPPSTRAVEPDRVAATGPLPARAVAKPDLRVVPAPVATEPVAQAPHRPSPAEKPPAPTASAGLDTVLDKAKAYRPLAQFVLREIEQRVPLFVASPAGSAIDLGGPARFGLIAVSGKDLRLALDLGEAPLKQPWERVRLPVTLARSSQPMTHMIVLTDVRQIDAALLDVVHQAWRRNNH